MHWLYLAMAIVLEVCGTTGMKLSEGFSRLTPSILMFVFYGLSFTLFVFALKIVSTVLIVGGVIGLYSSGVSH